MNNKSAEVLADLEKTLKDFGGIEGFNDLVNKATNNSTGFSTRQSLRDEVEDFTKRVTPLFDMLPREDVINPIHQWDAVTSLATGIGSYAGAIDTVGVDSDPIIRRYNEEVKYYRTTTTVGQFTNAMSRPQLKAQPTVDEKAIQAVKYDLERDIITGADGGNNIRGIDDIIQTFAAANENIDAGSVALTTTSDFDNAQRFVAEQGGIATHFLFNAEDRIAFKNLFDNQTRYPNPQTTNKFGYNVQNYLSAFGEVEILYDQFVPAKSTTSTAYVLDISSWSLGEPTVNGASGIAMQDLAKTGPQNKKLINYYGLLVYPAPVWNARIYNIA
jgi:hypothetical protein